MATNNKTMTKQKRQPVGMQNYGTIDPDYSRRVMNCNYEVMNIRNDKPKTPEEMQATINRYFQICANYALPPTVERFADLLLIIIGILY